MVAPGGAKLTTAATVEAMSRYATRAGPETSHPITKDERDG